MWPVGGDYWARPRHPWSCVLFVLPLLMIYEVQNGRIARAWSIVGTKTMDAQP